MVQVVHGRCASLTWIPAQLEMGIAGIEILIILFFVSSVGAVNLQTHRASLCPHDIAAVFVCEANGTAMFWRIRDNQGNDDELEHDNNTREGESKKRNDCWASLLRKSEVDQHYSFTSVLTIFATVGKELRINCSSDLVNDISQEIHFYYDVPAPPPPPVVTITPADAALQVNWTTPTNPGQNISYTEITLNDRHVMQVNSQHSNTFSVPAVAGTVSVQTVDACGQKSEVMMVNFPSPVTNSDESYPPEEVFNNLSKAPHTCEVCTWAVLLILLFTIRI